MTKYPSMSPYLVTLGLAACGIQDVEPPGVLGIQFGSSSEAFSQFLSDDASRESYPLIPAYGYKLNLPNPDNWSVIVQDSSEDMTRNQVYGIYISRMGSDSCTQDAADSLMKTIRRNQLAHFDQIITQPDANGIGVNAVGLSERRMLTVGVSCFIRTLSANFAYLDRDVFSYRDTLQVQDLMRQVSASLKGYDSRTLNR